MDHCSLEKNAQASTEPWIVVPWEMTELWLMVPPALCKVSPKIPRKQIGAITLLSIKKYCT